MSAARLKLSGFTAVLAVRAAVFPLARNFYGDPAMRLRALTEWMAHPFFLRSFVGAHQFGILHLYLLALTQWLHPNLDVGPRLLSLCFGAVTAFPLFSLAERRFGATAAFLATLGLAVYPLHIQTSTTATSEAVFLFFLLEALDQLDRGAAGSRRSLAFAGALMACASAVRYDGWLYGPLSCAWLLPALRRGAVSRGAAAGYALATFVVPIFLCLGNWHDLGDPLFIIHYIDEDHARMAQVTAHWMGRWSYVGYCLAFWPANLAWELTPPVAVGLAVGAVRAIRARHGFDLLALAAVPAAFFSLEGALLRFAPLARFTLPTAVLVLPYAGHGLVAIGQWLTPRLRPTAAVLAALTAIALPSYLAWRTLGKDDSFADTLRPLSPVSNLPPELEGTIDWVRTHARGKKVEIETNWLYEELPIDLYSRFAGLASFTPRFGTAPEGFEPPDVLVVPRDADLLANGKGALRGDMLLRADQSYRKVARIGRVTLFERVPNG